MIKQSKYLFLILGIALALIGCDGYDHPVVTLPAQEASPLQTYFPLSTGKAMIFSVQNEYTGQDTQEKFVVGQGLADGENMIYQWIYSDLSHPGIVDTGYFVQTGTALYFYDSLEAVPQKVLELPFETGKTWHRYDITARNEINLLESLITDFGNKYSDFTEDDDGYEEPKGYDDEAQQGAVIFGQGAGKNFPIMASGYFTLTAIEDVELGNGTVIKNCLRVESQAGSQYVNVYWYAENYGLIKYIIGASPESLALEEDPEGQVIGEILGH